MIVTSKKVTKMRFFTYFSIFVPRMPYFVPKRNTFRHFWNNGGKNEMKKYIAELASGPSGPSGKSYPSVYPGSRRLENVLSRALAAAQDAKKEHYTVLRGSEQFIAAADAGKLINSRIILAADIDESGINMESMKVLRYLNVNKKALEGAAGGVIIDGSGELFTKDLGRRLVFAANMAGCAFPGKPLVEATGSLKNFAVNAKLWNVSPEEAYAKSCSLLIEKVMGFKMISDEASDKPSAADIRIAPAAPATIKAGGGHHTLPEPKILAVHAGNRATSNSYSLWKEAADHLRGRADIEEISIRNGQVQDCRGCSYEDCIHFGEKAGCFYGGVMVEKVYPAILRSDVLVLICPNYNDSVSANIMAFINRLTALFRTSDFSCKRIYAIVVSGYSGGDIVAQQIIGAINMNKNFILPPRFAMLETANDPGTALKLPGIKERAKDFAEAIISYQIPD